MASRSSFTRSITTWRFHNNLPLAPNLAITKELFRKPCKSTQSVTLQSSPRTSKMHLRVADGRRCMTGDLLIYLWNFAIDNNAITGVLILWRNVGIKCKNIFHASFRGKFHVFPSWSVVMFNSSSTVKYEIVVWRDHHHYKPMAHQPKIEYVDIHHVLRIVTWYMFHSKSWWCLNCVVAQRRSTGERNHYRIGYCAPQHCFKLEAYGNHRCNDRGANTRNLCRFNIIFAKSPSIMF